MRRLLFLVAAAPLEQLHFDWGQVPVLAAVTLLTICVGLRLTVSFLRTGSVAPKVYLVPLYNCPHRRRFVVRRASHHLHYLLLLFLLGCRCQVGISQIQHWLNGLYLDLRLSSLLRACRVWLSFYEDNLQIAVCVLLLLRIFLIIEFNRAASDWRNLGQSLNLLYFLPRPSLLLKLEVEVSSEIAGLR